MMSKRERGTAIAERLHRVGRVHVLIAHEPARLVMADRQDGEPERPVAGARGFEIMPLAIPGIPDVKDAPGGRVDHESRPQGVVVVAHAARRPMAHWTERDGDLWA